MALRVLVVEDDGLTRSSVASALRLQEMEIVGEAASASEAMRAAHQGNPDVAVLDLDLGPGPNGADVAVALRRLYPAIGIVVLTTYDSPRLLAAQAPDLPPRTVFLRKRDIETVGDLVRAIRLSTEQRGRGVIATPGMAENFTDAQLWIMRAVADGLTNAEIARRRDVSERAVEQMMRRIAQRLGLPGDPTAFNQRVQLTRAYLEMTGNVAR